ncbi:MAG: aldo/keto reductase [Cyclobacteriaceae bacterium]|jgi:aryl-alcohol dehydrogenase-like predicted oxidoreductase
MSVPRVSIESDFSISRIIKGGWQLSQGHSEGNTLTALHDMQAFVDAGITTFDCADIYTGVEELIGRFLSDYRRRFGKRAPVEIFTKFVPDYDVLPQISKTYVEQVIDRSLKRLGVDELDMVQFSWWNYAMPRWMETALWLVELQRAGKIKHLGGTNFNTSSVQAMTASGVRLTTLQVQFSLLDHRPEKELIALCQQNRIHLVCYGTVAGGFLSERWLGQPEPQPPFENRSLVKYKLMIDEFGGWTLFQELLTVLNTIAKKHHVSLTNVATRYVLEKPMVAAAIIGARNAQHLDENLNAFSFALDGDDYASIEKVLAQRTGQVGDVFDLERIKDGPHGRIMRYNLNQQSIN